MLTQANRAAPAKLIGDNCEVRGVRYCKQSYGCGETEGAFPTGNTVMLSHSLEHRRTTQITFHLTLFNQQYVYNYLLVCTSGTQINILETAVILKPRWKRIKILKQTSFGLKLVPTTNDHDKTKVVFGSASRWFFTLKL